MSNELDNSDPMLEALEPGKICTEEPEANFKESNQIELGTKIFISNLPVGITAQGVTNLCLPCGKPVSVSLSHNGKSALVDFKTKNAALLAIRDLNDTPPSFLKVTYARSTAKTKQECSSVESDEGWCTTTFFKSTLKNKLSQSVDPSKKLKYVRPYFEIEPETHNPTLVLYQKGLDFKISNRCISMGRGYDIGGINYLNYGKQLICKKSDDWEDNNSVNTKCFKCGTLTFKRFKESNYNVCSKLCENELKSCSPEKSVFDAFYSGLSGVIEVNNDTDIHIPCTVVLDKRKKDFDRLKKELNSKTEPISGNEGDMVKICDDNGKYHRGTICDVSDGLYNVALVDHGVSIKVETVYSLSESCKEIVTFGGVLTFVGGSLPDIQLVKFRVKQKKYFGSWLCDLIEEGSDEVISEVILEQWLPFRKLTYVPLKEKCHVLITMYRDIRTVFIRRIDEHWEEEFCHLCNDVAAWSLEAKSYKKLPKLGEICSARCKEDGCFYRAIVRLVKRNSVKVTFIDFGNDQETQLQDLRYLPSVACNINCFAMRVILKDVANTSTPESVNYMNRLVAYETELTLTGISEGDDIEVTLTEASGNVVNKKVNDLMIPIWEKDPSVFCKSGPPIFLESLSEFTFTPGTTEDVFLLNFSENEFEMSKTFWATPYRNECLCHLNGELKRAMTEYCGYLVDDPYRPRKGELCLVEYNGDWYRAICLSDDDILCSTFLMDFGISTIVHTMKMRKIVEQFLHMPALALECTVAGYEDMDEDSQKNIVEYLIKMTKKCMKNVNIVDRIDDVYHLSIPFAASSPTKSADN